MSAELATVQHSGRAMLVADTIQVEAEQRKLLGEYVAKQMTEGTDYGVIPGTKNKTLLKPGAEKLTALFRCSPRFVIEEKIENWDTGLFFYRFSCQVVTLADGTVVAEGVGSCSTYESRYRWRNAAKKCPECGKEAIIKGKAEYGGGWLCFKKKDGCGAKFADGDEAIEGQATGRVENPDLCDCANTVLKIAKKRALVDASIALARCSDLFTQDMEDFVQHEDAPVPQRQPSKPARDLAAELRACENLPALAAFWSSLTPEQKQPLAALKEQRKAELTPKAATEGDNSPDPTPAKETKKTKYPSDADMISPQYLADLAAKVAEHESYDFLAIMDEIAERYHGVPLCDLNPTQRTEVLDDLTRRLKAPQGQPAGV